MAGVAVCAEPVSPNSLFNRENTGNLFVFGAEIHQNLPDLTVLKGGFREIALKTEQGITGNCQGNWI